MPHKKLESLRKKVITRKKRKKSMNRKKQAKQAGERFARKRRVKRNNPEGKREKFQATGRQARLLAAELGITVEQAKSVQKQATTRLDRALEAGGDALDSLDTDGDGDTDILSSFEEQMTTQQHNTSQTSGGGSKSQSPPGMVDPAEPVLPLESPKSKKSKTKSTSPVDADFEKDLLDL